MSTNTDVRSLVQNLRVVILPGTRPSAEQVADYNSAYAMWKLVWSETFKELDGTERIYSDDFTRTDEIICIFKDQTCLAMSFMRWVDFSLETAHEDSYFKAWPKEAKTALGSRGPSVIVCSNLTVHPLARGHKLGLPYKDVIAGLVIERLKEANVDAMTGTMRVDRGMNKTTYQFGAQLLVPNLIYHSVPVDLVAFYPDRLIASTDPVIAESVDLLWKRYREPGLNSPMTKKAA